MFLRIIFILVNVILFLNGLLPIRSTSSQFSNSEQKTQKISNARNFDRTVIMVIDALRTDFVNDDFMPLTTTLIKKHGCLIDVSVASPTVTLPRIKSLITGSVPQFTDLFHNLGSAQILDDSLVHRARKRDSQIVFYGDETWLKILPNNTFLRYNGTSSFYVNDFYEVDDNVTKHLDLELQRNDWDMMILHYLGLDHIGHVHGPFSNLVPSKLHEMDMIFSRIFENFNRSNLSSLVILTGDHGMRDSGGHGGSTYSETHVPLGVLGVSCDNGHIDQVDITPNLAILLGLEIPSSSIGKLTRLLLKNLTLHQYLVALFHNTEVLNRKHGEDLDEFESISRLHKSYLEQNDTKTAILLTQMCIEYSEKISRKLIEASTQQDIFSMLVSVIFLCYSFITHLKRKELFKIPLFNHLFYLLLLIMRLFSFDIIVLVPVLIASIFQMCDLPKICIKNSTYIESFILLFFLFFQPITWLSSSFIEEEHEYWYFILNAFFVFQIFKGIENKSILSVSWFFISILFRFAETLNQMGDKWASLPDSSDFLLKPENYFFHSTLIGCSIFFIYYYCLRSCRSIYHLEKLILILIFLYKLNVFNQIILPRIIYILLLLYFVFSRDYLNSWILLIALLTKASNLCVIPLSVYTSRLIVNEYRSTTVITCLHLLLSKSLYFVQGNGNNIANIDVAVGYTALSTYNPVLVGLQLLVNIYSTTILMHLQLYISTKNDKFFYLLYAERLFSTIAVCIVTMIFRNHIFIWSVYAPKLCIESAHTIVFIVELLFFNVIFRLFKNILANFRGVNSTCLKPV
ncbi:GPI ethanolamine phosphate transferase 2 [Harmonia axyridis]|uniref:GPI ethanolamine phosphate transferase 2 n=1 Tax=Harmonia axyridis TaxID=115357 RepID=UPI001E276795|nr:GPI ethanolamine phosphate transferase 2 [Harmonia axyridis]